MQLELEQESSVPYRAGSIDVGNKIFGVICIHWRHLDRSICNTLLQAPTLGDGDNSNTVLCNRKIVTVSINHSLAYGRICIPPLWTSTWQSRLPCTYDSHACRNGVTFNLYPLILRLDLLVLYISAAFEDHSKNWTRGHIPITTALFPETPASVTHASGTRAQIFHVPHQKEA